MACRGRRSGRVTECYGSSSLDCVTCRLCDPGRVPSCAVPQFLQALHNRTDVQAEWVTVANVLRTVSPSSTLTISILLKAPSIA